MFRVQGYGVPIKTVSTRTSSKGCLASCAVAKVGKNVSMLGKRAPDLP